VKSELRQADAAYKLGLRAERLGNWEDAYDQYSDAVILAPEEPEYARRREIAKNQLVQTKLNLAERDAAAGRMAEAQKELLAASNLDPTNRTVIERFAELGTLRRKGVESSPTHVRFAGEIHLAPAPGTRDFDLRTDTQGAYREVARQFGVDVTFDSELRSKPVRFQFAGVDFVTAMRLLGDMTGTFWHPFTTHLAFVADDTAQNRKTFAPSIVQTLLLPASETPGQMTEILRCVRDITGITRADLDRASRTITLRASPQALAVATALIEDLEKPAAELVLEAEVLDVDRSAARQLGLAPPQSAQAYTVSTRQIQQAAQSYAGLVDVIEQVFGTSSVPSLVAFGGGASTFLGQLPNTAANFSEVLSLVRHGRRILLRAQDGQPATFFVGDRYPVSLSSDSASQAATSSTANSLVSPITNYAAGNSPSFVVTASLRDDGLNDLVIANSADNTISVLLGDSEGVFGTQTTYATGTDPVWVATGQFNGSARASGSDSFLDLAVANKGANTISILLGHGDGTFQQKSDIVTGATPVSIVAGDFHDADGSGFTDLAVANQGDDSISVFQANGDGTFKTPTLTQLPTGFAPGALAAADLNGDGHLDLIVADSGNNTFSVLLGNGDGTFMTRADYATGNEPVYVALGDFDGDGAVDIAVANHGAPTASNTGNTVSVYYNEQNGASEPLGKFVAGATRDFAAGNGPTSIAVADYDLDGGVDLAVSDQTDNAITILLNAGNKSFTALSELAVGKAPLSIASADFNGDGRPDAAIADNGSAEATVVLNSTSLFGTGASSSNTTYPGVEYLDIGLKLKATPRIHLNDEVTLDLEFNLSSLSSESINSIPVLNNDTITERVRVKQNETAVIAGILEGQASGATSGTPGVASIPELGSFEGDQDVQESNRELLILITPRMVRSTDRTNHFIYAGQGSLDGSGSEPAAAPFTPQSAEGPTPPPQPPAQSSPPAGEQPAGPPPAGQPGTPDGQSQQPAQPSGGQSPP
jgi:hypothetical protein